MTPLVKMVRCPNCGFHHPDSDTCNMCALIAETGGQDD